jgi:Flp pilus assembly pilin Flp
MSSFTLGAFERGIAWTHSRRSTCGFRKGFRARIARGQTMTEYALILSAVAVVVYSGYKSMGNAIKNVLTTVDGNL